MSRSTFLSLLCPPEIPHIDYNFLRRNVQLSIDGVRRSQYHDIRPVHSFLCWNQAGLFDIRIAAKNLSSFHLQKIAELAGKAFADVVRFGLESHSENHYGLCRKSGSLQLLHNEIR